MEKSLSNLYGSFSVKYIHADEPWLLHLIPEMAPASEGLTPLGCHFIYCVHPYRGSITFSVEQDENGEWYSDKLPVIIEPELIR